MSVPESHVPARPLRLCVIINTLSVGGAETQLARICRELSPRDVEVTIVSFDSHGSTFELKDAFDKTPARVIVFDRDKIGRLRFIFRLRKLLRQERFDIIHCWHGTANQYGAVAAILARGQRILTGYRNFAIEPLVFRWLDRRIEPFTIGRVVNSNAIREKHSRTIGYPIEKLFVLHNGLDPEEFQSLPPAEQVRRDLGFDLSRPLLLTVGRLVQVKQQHLFIEAARLLTEWGLDLQFGLVGDGPERTRLEDLVKKYELSGRVRFLGKRFDILAFLSSATLSVCTSETEGFPNVVLESMMAGVPAITTDNGGGPELIGNVEQVVPVGDASSLAERIRSAMISPERLAQWAARGRDRAFRHFTSAASAQRYLQILRDAMSGGDL